MRAWLIVALTSIVLLGSGLAAAGIIPSGVSASQRAGMTGERAPTSVQAAAVAPQTKSDKGSTIAVSGEGIVKAQPDVAYVRAGVQNSAASAQEAQQENARLMNAVITKLQGMGFTNNDLRTSGLSLQPVYDKSTNPTAYRATNQVVVTVGEVGQAGTVFDAVVGAGANQAGDIQFGIKDNTSLRQQALREAVKTARAKGDAIASEMGVQISAVDGVTEESAGGPPMVRYDRGTVAAAAPPTPVLPGELTVTARVRAIYRY